MPRLSPEVVTIQAVQGPHGNGGRLARIDEHDHSLGVHPVRHPAPGGGREKGREGGWSYLGGLGGQGQGQQRRLHSPSWGRAAIEMPREGAAGKNRAGRRRVGRLCLRSPAPSCSRPARLTQVELGRTAEPHRWDWHSSARPGRRTAPASCTAGPGDHTHTAASAPAPRHAGPCRRRPLHQHRYLPRRNQRSGEGGRTGLKPGVRCGTLDATSDWRLTTHTPGRHCDKAASPRGPPTSLRDVHGPEERGLRNDTGPQQPRLHADVADVASQLGSPGHSLRSSTRNGPLGAQWNQGRGRVDGRLGQPRPGQCRAGWGSRAAVALSRVGTNASHRAKAAPPPRGTGRGPARCSRNLHVMPVGTIHSQDTNHSSL